MPASETGYFVAVAANGHGAPASPARARMVAKEKGAIRIGADTQARSRSLHNDLRGGTRNGRQQPIQAAFASLEFHFPGVARKHQFVVSFRNAQNLVDRFNPFPRYALVPHHSSENFS